PQIQAQKRAPALTHPQACILLAAVLPRRTLTPGQAIQVVRYIQHNNHKAKVPHYLHYKRRTGYP
ncbi:MAG: hypothetical protein ISS72_08275, partial [Candidatus Brocadiae bacterium]|nr:hypothetical protein [Candidatus Brocadiia bacterium]